MSNTVLASPLTWNWVNVTNQVNQLIQSLHIVEFRMFGIIVLSQNVFFCKCKWVQLFINGIICSGKIGQAIVKRNGLAKFFQ